MFFQFLKKKAASLGISPLGLLVVSTALGSALFFGKNASKSPDFSEPPAKKTTGWFKLSQVGNPKLLESLAKKEQIERDLTMFQSVANATVALSLPTEDDPNIVPQVSVILSSHKNEVFSSSLLLSITDYLSSSIPGLNKEHITLSDNLGNIYSPGEFPTNSLLLSACEGYLGKIFPKEHFSLAYLATKNSPTVQLTINEKYLAKFPKEKREAFLIHAEDHLKKICGNTHAIVIEKFPFSQTIQKDRLSYKLLVGGTILLSSLGIIALASFYLAFYAYERIPVESKKIKQGINITKLVEILQKESPEKIRLILSYLDPNKADEIFNHLPEDVKHQVLKL
ncbi:type III secretion system protein,Secretory protein of YscJ/FliF family [Chlamydia poikilotherma]|uniref:Type III secretion system protein,Secretory protein of YscJ/FliF family n=1 Tax=Chlamydia poikilotherma TaxID=1967783 RepID=A0A3B0PWZ9_9CHLA|nr:type III secretion system protein [Chlamydia poikilotherma]SYX09366.1 type III secretion system protein,Secretory protein of YscJ/FliF family [Chlamydia poikilotherma]